MRADDASVGSRSTSSRSLSGGFSIDWDEIDSIAEESLSVASSVSSGQRRRRKPTASSTRQRNRMGCPDYESMETGGAYESNSKSAESKKKKQKKKPSALQQKRWPSTSGSRYGESYFPLLKRVGLLLVLSMFVSFSMHSVEVSLPDAGIFVQSVSRKLFQSGGERRMRVLLGRAIDEYGSRTWPVSVRDEEGDFEHILHPANDQVTLSVPKFYLMEHDRIQTLNGMSKELSSMVGRTVVEGSQDFSVRTIFVGISNYRDWHCRYTIESLFSRAKHPNRIRVAVVDQLEKGQDQSCDLPITECRKKPEQALCQYQDQIDVYEMESNLSVGPTFSQHIVNRMYRGEYYALQVDPHVKFVQDWDEEIIGQLESTGNDLGIITTYLDDALGSIDDMAGISQRRSRQVICNADFVGTGHERHLVHDIAQQPDSLPAVEGMAQLQPFWSAQFSFSRGHFILNVIYDPYLPMVDRDGEEISIGLRAFTNGYDFYTPESNVAFDTAYNDKESRKSFLDHKSIYRGHDLSSFKRLYGMIGLDGEFREEDYTYDPFGIGRVRSIEAFWTAFGIHPHEKITEQKLCSFVQSGRMHKLFHQYLKPDGMGIDYGSISYRFHELQHNHDGGN